MKQVLVVPPWEPWLENRMFRGAEGCVYSSAFRLWRERAKENGFLLDTWDTKPVNSADCIWMMDLPRRKSTFDRIKRGVRPAVPFVLQVLESPLITPQSFVEANRRLFDAVVSYEPGLDESRMQFSYHLPNSVHLPARGRPFSERRCAVMLNSNRLEGWFATRQQGWEGLPGVGRHLTGWKLPLSRLLQPAKGQLYSWRRNLARAADKLESDVLDVYGNGWSGQQISWFPLHRNRNYRCAASTPFDCVSGIEQRQSKADLFSYYRFGIGADNYRGGLGYISEKLFDVFAAGAVPVYLGEERIHDYVPRDVFVDVANFQSCRELLLYLNSCPEREWEPMREAGEAFLRADAFRPFTAEHFSNRMVHILRRLICGTAQERHPVD